MNTIGGVNGIVECEGEEGPIEVCVADGCYSGREEGPVEGCGADGLIEFGGEKGPIEGGGSDGIEDDGLGCVGISGGYDIVSSKTTTPTGYLFS
ncbi:hypothetical protein V6N13_083417 [Hibiscus sabdariffa]